MKMATLSIIQGFLGAGKTTFSKRLAQKSNTIRLNADEWVAQNFSTEDQNRNWDACFSKAMDEIWIEAENLLRQEKDVILDIGFWTIASRMHARNIAITCYADFKHYYVFAPDDVLLKRLKQRSGVIAERNIQNFYEIKKAFEEPTSIENAIFIQSKEAFMSSHYNELIEALKSYNKILIVGAPGVGKSFLSKKIGNDLNVPVHHLDKMFWQPNWVASDQSVFEEKISNILSQDRFIMEGTYMSTFKKRISHADIVVLVETRVLRRFYRIISRTLKSAGKSRDDLAEGCVEKLSISYFSFLKWAMRFEEKKKRIIAEGAEAGVKIIIYNNS
jgi:adenylate kinase family enzyme